ncbi:MAG: hypothetical protein LBJ69_01380, partial [Holosporales bacterium]|nr:hypothetical protein [Holosporales bacterium]
AASRISIAYTAVVLAGILVSSGYAIRVYHTCFNRKTLLTTPANQCSSYILSHTQKFVLLLLVGITTLFGIWPNLVLKVF